MSRAQPGILAPPPPLARYLYSSRLPGADPRSALASLGAIADGDATVVGVGASLVLTLEREIPGLRTFPCQSGVGVDVPSTPASLLCWLRGDDRGELVHRTRAIEDALSSAFATEEIIDAFQYGAGLDLSGYVDGTENPKGDAATEAALISGRGPGLDGGSFVAVQRWVHDLDRLAAMTEAARDHVVGRRRSNNEEIADAPPSAHVKRTAQESFDPPAFVLRRSMPWADARAAGLVFVAFGKSFDAFEALLARMTGAEDGIVDALFRFTRPVSGGYFFCPPIRDGHLDLAALGLA